MFDKGLSLATVLRGSRDILLAELQTCHLQRDVNTRGRFLSDIRKDDFKWGSSRNYLESLQETENAK